MFHNRKTVCLLQEGWRPGTHRPCVPLGEPYLLFQYDYFLDRFPQNRQIKSFYLSANQIKIRIDDDDGSVFWSCQMAHHLQFPLCV